MFDLTASIFRRTISRALPPNFHGAETDRLVFVQPD